MRDWKDSLGSIRNQIQKEKAITIILPSRFSFKHHDIIDFEDALSIFDWSLKNRHVKNRF